MAGLREVLVTLGVEVDKGSEQKVKSSLDRVVGFAKAAAAAFAAFKVGQVAAAFVDEMRGMGDELDKTSIQLGLTTSQLQELRHAANLAGVDGRAFSDSLGRLQKNAFEAAKGNKTLTEDFARLGVTVKDSSGNLKSADVLLAEMAEGISKLDNDSEKVALSLNLMGRAGRKLLPMFTQGAAGVKAARDETKKLGVGLTQDVIDKSVILTDNQARAELAMLSLKNVIARELIPIFNEIALSTIEIASALRGPLMRGVESVKTVFRGLESGLKFITDKFDTFGKTVLALTAIMAGLGVVFMITGKQGFLAGVKAAAGWVLAMAPALLFVALLAAIGAAIFLVIEDLVKMGEGAESVSGTIVEGFNNLVDELGSIPAAIDEMLKTAVAFWAGFFKDTLGLSDSFVENLVATFGELTQTTIAFWTEVWDSIRAGWNSITSWLASVWQGVVDAIDFAFGGAVRAMIAGVQALVAFIMGDFQQAATFAVVAMEQAWSQIKNTFIIVWEAIKAAFTFWFSTVPEFVGGVMATTWELLKSGFMAVVDFYKAVWMALWEAAVAVVTFAFEGLKSWFSAYMEFLGSLWTTAVAFWRDVIVGWIDGIVETVSGAFTGVVQAVMGIWDPVVAFWRSLFDGFIGGITEKFGAVAGFFGKLFGGESPTTPAAAPAQAEQEAAGRARAPAAVAVRVAGRPPAPAQAAAQGAPMAPTREPLASPSGVSGGAPIGSAAFGGAAPASPAFGAPEVGAPGVLRQQVVNQIAGAAGAATPQEAGAMMSQGAASLATIAPAASAPMLAGPPVVVPPMASAAPTITNAPTTSVEVSVNASGRDNPSAIAEQVAKQVNTALERRDRQTMRAFTTAVATGGA